MAEWEEIKATLESKQTLLDLLCEDSYYRKLGNWPLVNVQNLDADSARVDQMCVNGFFSPGWSDANIDPFESNNENHEDSTNLFASFPNLQHLMKLGDGHVYAAGECIHKILSVGDDNNLKSADLYLCGLEVEEAGRLLDVMISYWLGDDEKTYRFARYDYQSVKLINLITLEICITISMQLYHNPSAIAGSFAISTNAFIMDSNGNMLTTPLGAYTFYTLNFPVDVSRITQGYDIEVINASQCGFLPIFITKDNHEIEEIFNGMELRKPVSFRLGGNLLASWKLDNFTLDIEPTISSNFDTDAKNTQAVVNKEFHKIEWMLVKGKHWDFETLEHLDTLDELDLHYPTYRKLLQLKTIFGTQRPELARKHISIPYELRLRKFLPLYNAELAKLRSEGLQMRFKAATTLFPKPVSEWYNKFLRASVRIGIPFEVCCTLYKGRKESQCYLSWLPKDIFRMLMLDIYGVYVVHHRWY